MRALALTLLAGAGLYVWSQPSSPSDSQQHQDAQVSQIQARLASFVPVTWHVTGSRCADGWASPSIGKAGACSHHGGVITLWQGSDGQTLACSRGFFPPGKEAQFWASERGRSLTCHL